MRAAGIERHREPDGVVAYRFRRARAVGAAAGLTTFTLLWCGVAVMTLWFGAPVLFPLAFGAFGLVLLALVGRLWLRQTRVRVSASGIEFTRRWLGPGRTSRFVPEQITALRVDRGMQAGLNLYYRIVLEVAGRGSYTLAGQIADLRLARGLVREMRAALAG